MVAAASASPTASQTQLHGGPGHDATDDGTSERVCRFCFDSSTQLSPLVSPCSCRGSQRWVHLHCLRGWQACVLSGKQGGEHIAEKAHRCSVCLTRFTLAPLRPGAWQALSLWCHGALLALACLLLLAATGGAQAVAATGWQHVALLTLLLLLGARSQPVMLLVLLLLLGTVGTLCSRGLMIGLNAPYASPAAAARPAPGGAAGVGAAGAAAAALPHLHTAGGVAGEQAAAQVDVQASGTEQAGSGATGRPWSLAHLFSWAAPTPRPPPALLRPGALLVAAPALAGHPMFGHSVVLLLNHSVAEGAVGLVLNKPLTPGFEDAAASPWAPAAAAYARLRQQQQQQQQRAAGGGGAAGGPSGRWRGAGLLASWSKWLQDAPALAHAPQQQQQQEGDRPSRSTHPTPRASSHRHQQQQQGPVKDRATTATTPASAAGEPRPSAAAVRLRHQLGGPVDLPPALLPDLHLLGSSPDGDKLHLLTALHPWIRDGTEPPAPPAAARAADARPAHGWAPAVTLVHDVSGVVGARPLPLLAATPAATVADAQGACPAGATASPAASPSASSSASSAPSGVAGVGGSAEGGGACAAAPAQQHAATLAARQWFVGGEPVDVLLLAANTSLFDSPPSASSSSSPSSSPPSAGADSGNGSSADAGPAAAEEEAGEPLPRTALVFHGRACWLPGQLEAELRRGVWTLAPGGWEDVQRAVQQPAGLWAHLQQLQRRRRRLAWLWAPPALLP